MLRIALFTPTLESIILLSPVYREIENSGNIMLFYDVVEEHGWFEKGIQYTSLEYSKPRRVIRELSGEGFYREINRIISKDEPDIAVLAGYSPATLKLLKILRKHGLKTIHLEAGLRNYIDDYWEALRQAIDWNSIFNILPSKMHHDNLRNEGFPIDQMYITGSLYVDSVLTNMSSALTSSNILEELGVERYNYVYSYVTSRNISKYSKYLGEASLTWDMDVVIPLRRDAKDSLKRDDLYYKLLNEYFIMAIEQVDYLDHINLIYNSSSIFTDDPRIALEASILKKQVYILDESQDLYGLGRIGTAKYISPDRLSEIDVKQAKRPIKDIKSLYGGGESRFRVLEAIEGFSRASYRDAKWRGFYVKKDGQLTVSDIKYDLEGV